MDTSLPPADAGSVTQDARLAALAQSLDCMTEDDLCLLAKVTLSTTEGWRKRRKGPGYILIGNRYLYPRAEVAKHLQTLVREVAAPSGRGEL